MSSYPEPVYLGQTDPAKAGDAFDFYIDMAPDLVAGEVISSVVFTVTDSAGAVIPNVVPGSTETGTRTDFRIACPVTVGVYQITAVFTIDDGQKLTRVVELIVV